MTPEINAARNPAVKYPIPSVSIEIAPSKRSFAIFPKIKGTTIKKENLAALDLSTPKITEAEIVAPDLEIPGRIAIACAIPMKKALENVTGLFVFLALSARKSSIAVKININPTNTTLPPKRASNCFSNIKPTIPAGTMEIKILTAN